MSLDLIVFQAANGLVWGLILALIALGLSLIYGILNIINIAHASFYMLGAVFAWAIIERVGNFWVALLVAPVLVGLISILIERVILQRIVSDFNLSILATVGLLMVIQDAVLGTFGGDLQRIDAPVSGSISLFGFQYPLYRACVALAAIVVIAGCWALLYQTRFGSWVRAVRQDRQMALAVGIPVPLVFALTVGLGGAMAGLAGVLAAPIVVVEYQMGLKVLATAFIIVVVGGFGSLPGSVLAAVLIGCFEGLLTSFVDATAAKMGVLLLLSGFVLWRPEGLLSTRRETLA
jgi:branched-chain amino acid transport system permease protein